MKKKHSIYFLIIGVLFVFASTGIAEINFNKGDIQVNTVQGAVNDLQQMLCDDNNVYFAWRDSRNDPTDYGERDIYFRKFNIESETWSDEIRINTGPNGLSYYPINGIHGFCTDKKGNIYITWLDDEGIYFSYSHDSGQTWCNENKFLIAEDDIDGDIYSINLGCDNKDNVYLIWGEEDQNEKLSTVYIIKSSDKGQTWSSFKECIQDIPFIPNPFVIPPFETFPTYPSFFNNNNGSLYILWLQYNGTAHDLYLIFSEDFGDSWSATAKKINNTYNIITPFYSFRFVCDDIGNAYAAWISEQNKIGDIFLNRTADGGKTWLDYDIKIDTDQLWENDSWLVSLGCDDTGNVYVAWKDERSSIEEGFNFYFNCSHDFGQTWKQEDVRINEDSSDGNFYGGGILTNGSGNVYAIWLDTRNSDSGCPDIYMNYSDNCGENWQAEDIVVSQPFSILDLPIGYRPLSCVSDNGDVYVSWLQGSYSPFWNNEYNSMFTYSNNGNPPNIIYLRLMNGLRWIGKDEEDGYRLNFYYRIDEGKWNGPTKRMYMTVSEVSGGLTPGVHLFSIKAVDSEGAESEVKSVEFSIGGNTPPRMLYLASVKNGNFRWLGADYEDGYKITYIYRVDEGEWSSPTKWMHVPISQVSEGLEPGVHVFQVIAIDSEGLTSEAMTLKFTI